MCKPQRTVVYQSFPQQYILFTLFAKESQQCRRCVYCESSTMPGPDIPLLGETTIYFSVSGLETSCRVLVTNVLTERILGIDWLRKNQCVWDFGCSSFVMKGRQSQLSCKKEKQRVRKIIVDDDVVFPGQHTAYVSILVTRSFPSHEDRDLGLTRKIKDADLVIANTIYDRDQVRSCCQVWNISDLPKRLKKRSEIGWAEPIEIIETEQSEVSDEGSRQNYETVQDGPLDLRQVKTIQIPDSDMTSVRSPDSSDSGTGLRTSFKKCWTISTWT